MSEHTKEPWVSIPAKREWHANGDKAIFDDGVYYILPESNTERLPIAIIDHGNDHYAPARLQGALDARRIVVCVNYCAGITNERIEDDMKQGVNAKDQIDAHDLYRGQRDVAWQELREIRDAIKANPEESTADEVRRVVSQRDELLEALKLVDAHAELYSTAYSKGDNAFEAAKNAIAKVEQS